MSIVAAQAYPRKHFFVEMFTRDITLTECILDLIDNSIDGQISRAKLDLGKDLLTAPSANHNACDLPMVAIKFSADEFAITDNCGGIDLERAKSEVFNFGYAIDQPAATKHQLGVYGIGMKRALFKIGRKFTVKSRTMANGFDTEVDLDEWTARDKTLKDWTFDLTTRTAARTKAEAGTSIVISRLREEVSVALEDATFTGRLMKNIGQVYALFLSRYIRVSVNGKEVLPDGIPFGQSDEISPAKSLHTFGSVSVYLMASVAARDDEHPWKQEFAGWYVGCNGRLVVTADKTDLTGWGTGALPAFHSKYRGFVGLALFQSANPLDLPWRTSKRGLNQESLVYQKARMHMNVAARPVLSFLDKLYPSELSEKPAERAVAAGATSMDVRSLTSRADRGFDVKPRRRIPDATTVKVQYDALRGDVERVRKHIRRPDFGAGQVGKYTFEAYLKREVSK